METQPAILKRLSRFTLLHAETLALVAALAVVALWLINPILGWLAVAGLAGVVVALAAWQWPFLPVALLLVVAPFNFGKNFSGAVLKLTEAATGLMLLTAMLRLATGDRESWQRVERASHVLLMLGLLSLLALVTSALHPNFFNVRYEIQNYIAMAYALIFFRRRHWPLLAGLVCFILLAETYAALILKFNMHLTGVNFSREGGGAATTAFTSEDLELLAGGRFRLSGTFAHKNVLAAFYVLLLPMATLALLRRPHGRMLAVIVVLPSLAVLAMTDSMTGWGAMALIVTLMLLHLRRFDYLAVFALLLAPLAALALYKFGATVFFRIEQVVGSHGGGYGTVSSRMEILRIALRLIAEHPWLGIGRNNFLTYGQTMYGHAHNLFLMKVVETGIPGGLIFTGFIVAVLARGWRMLLTQVPRLTRQNQYYRTLGLWLGCLGFTAMNLLDYNYSNFSMGPLYCLMLGVTLAVAWDEERQNPSYVSSLNQKASSC